VCFLFQVSSAAIDGGRLLRMGSIGVDHVAGFNGCVSGRSRGKLRGAVSVVGAKASGRNRLSFHVD